MNNSQPIPAQQLFQLAGDIGDIADEEPITADLLEKAAEELDVPLTHIYAALLYDPSLQPEREHEVAFEVCLQRCQFFGSVATLTDLLALKHQRESEEKPGFDVVPRGCLDRCDYPPVVCSRSSHGVHLHGQVNAEKLEELVDGLCS
jgi:NADH:ubiquinone oxidoreductase subunit E